MKIKLLGGVAIVLGLGGLLVACAGATKKSPAAKSGYFYTSKTTTSMQDDDFDNPGFLWVDIGAENWSKKDGKAGKACATCHGKAEKSMKGVATRYPLYSAKDKKLRTVQDQINYCRTTRMKAKAWKWDKDNMLGMTMYVKSQSRGMPINVKVDGVAKPFFEAGRKFYNQRRGMLDMACANCHVDYPGGMIRANRLSEGMPNGFPLYRLKWQKPGSLHRRFKGCNKQVRSKPYKQGSDEYTNLELFIMWRAQGLAIETPAVRM